MLIRADTEVGPYGLPRDTSGLEKLFFLGYTSTLHLESAKRGHGLAIKTIYLVKDLARATGHSVYTIEYYLKEKLIQEFGRGPETRYRYFDESAVRRIHQIRELRKKGKSIREIKKRLDGKEQRG